MYRTCLFIQTSGTCNHILVRVHAALIHPKALKTAVEQEQMWDAHQGCPRKRETL